MSEQQPDRPANEPVIAKRGPYPVRVEAGKNYFWCACGRSQNQPYCDGSHKGTGFSPVKFEAEENEIVHFCGCKHSKDQPFCDGTHHSVGGC
ncbi:MAG: CDGSH iron-sulfur domain-containing protein [Pseudomonadota bacterium]